MTVIIRAVVRYFSFVNIPQHDVFPLADTLDQILRIGQQEMGRPVEIEFAVNMDPSDHTKGDFLSVTQIRPIVDNKEIMDEDLSLVKNEETILSSTSVFGAWYRWRRTGYYICKDGRF